MQEIVTPVSRPSAVNNCVNDVLCCGEVRAPVELEHVIDLLRVWSGVNVNEEWVLVSLVEIVREIEPDFCVILAAVDLDVQV